MDEAIHYFTQSSLKKSVPELRPGDTVRVHQRIREGNKDRIQIFEGVVMAVRGSKAINSSFVVRRIASGVGVEKTFPLHSPNVVKVERIKSSTVRQARLFYLRERFGRRARMSGEIRQNEDWHENKVEDDSHSQSQDSVTESSEIQPEELPIEAAEASAIDSQETDTPTDFASNAEPKLGPKHADPESAADEKS